MITDRKQAAFQLRTQAAELARYRFHPPHEANGDEQRFASACYPMSFTKGLAHDDTTGLVADPQHFLAFRRAIDEGHAEAFSLHVPVPAPTEECPHRKWEAPTAGLAFDLEGPDPEAVTMPPAPALGTSELDYEMAEVYELALVRDVHLTEFQTSGTDATLTASIARLNALAYRPADGEGRPRKTDASGNIDMQTAFRGSSPGVEEGPYLSQFLLVGSGDQPGVAAIDGGKITYGALQIDQKVPVAKEGIDYMTAWDDWFDVQNGCDVQDDVEVFAPNTSRRFILKPRDLATYVHYDALYEAYLNACLILLATRAPFDPGFGSLSGDSSVFVAGTQGSLDRNAGGFALWGGPHILTLVTEVATRALKAVRFQKFNNHLRLRPEALAARLHRADAIAAQFPAAGALFQDMAQRLSETMDAVRAHNGSSGTALLPMAFQEGSPMHPSYGAGHATVAGACVTILKAWFDTSAVFVKQDGVAAFRKARSGDVNVAYTPNTAGDALDESTPERPLTLEGELNKLAANVSIGRNMAGVHYFSDYYDSARMGEQIALGLLEEQALCYMDPFVLSVPTFDGKVVRIGRR